MTQVSRSKLYGFVQEFTPAGWEHNDDMLSRRNRLLIAAPQGVSAPGVEAIRSRQAPIVYVIP